MKNFYKALLVPLVIFSVSACESASEKELRLERNYQIKMAKIANGQDAIEQEMRHERSLAYIQRPIAPGSYIDYRGNSSYGYWQNGGWLWNDPQSSYAMQSRQYVDYQMATGVLTTAVLTQALWNSNHSSGWQSTNVTVNNYTSTDGKTISKAKYKKRNKSIARKRNKAKAKAKLKAKSRHTSKAKPVNTKKNGQ